MERRITKIAFESGNDNLTFEGISLFGTEPGFPVMDNIEFSPYTGIVGRQSDYYQQGYITFDSSGQINMGGDYLFLFANTAAYIQSGNAIALLSGYNIVMSAAGDTTVLLENGNITLMPSIWHNGKAYIRKLLESEYWTYEDKEIATVDMIDGGSNALMIDIFGNVIRNDITTFDLTMSYDLNLRASNRIDLHSNNGTRIITSGNNYYYMMDGIFLSYLDPSSNNYDHWISVNNKGVKITASQSTGEIYLNGSTRIGALTLQGAVQSAVDPNSAILTYDSQKRVTAIDRIAFRNWLNS